MVPSTYIGKSSGTSGDKSGTNVLFNVGASASDSATALAAAINSTNSHNAANTVASATWTFNATVPAEDTIQLLVLPWEQLFLKPLRQLPLGLTVILMALMSRLTLMLRRRQLTPAAINNKNGWYYWLDDY